MEVSRPAGRVLRAIARSQFLRRRQGHSPALLSLTARLAAERNTKKEPSRISSLLDLLQYISNSLVYAAEAESGYRRTQQPQVHNQEQPTNQSNPIQSNPFAAQTCALSRWQPRLAGGIIRFGIGTGRKSSQIIRCDVVSSPLLLIHFGYGDSDD
jgi:hypothetical protein